MPMHDAKTNPLGMGLTIDGWPRHRFVRQLGRQRGFTVPTPDRVNLSAKPARLVIDHGILKAWCTDCIGAAEDVWRDRWVMFCMRCGNATAGGLWRPVQIPDNLPEIEALLGQFPTELQNWEPWGPPRDLAAEVEEWLSHAAVTADPDHGLTDNEVQGADDPEIWTPPFIATTNAIIASSDCNAGYRGNLLWLRQFFPANPAGAGYVPESTGADGAAWVIANQAKIISWLGYTPLNRAGGTMAGNISFVDDVEGIFFADGSGMRGNNGAGELQTFADKWVMYNEAGSQTRATITNLVAAFLGAVSGASAAFTGALSAASAAITGLVSAGSVVASGNVTGNRLSASVADGATAPIIIDAAQANVASPNLRAASAAVATLAADSNALGTVAAAGYPTLAGGGNFTTAPTIAGDKIAVMEVGTYAGNNADGRQITVGFRCRKVEIYFNSGGVMFMYHVYSTTPGVAIGAIFSGGSFVASSQNTALHGTDGFLVSASGTNDLNVTGNTYTYVAYGWN